VTKIPYFQAFSRSYSECYLLAHACPPGAPGGHALGAGMTDAPPFPHETTPQRTSLECRAHLLCSMLLLTFIALGTPAAAEPKTSSPLSKSYGIEIPLPASLAELPSSPLEQGQLLISANTPGSTSGFPTFNALLIAGSFPAFGKPANEQGEQVAASYRLVGLSDAKLESAVADDFRGFPRLIASLSYRTTNLPMSSRVVILELLDKHLILTLTAPREESRELETLSNVILERIVIPPSQSPREKQLSEADAGVVFSFPHALEAITAVIILVAGAFVLMRRFSRRKAQED
jgi:hypothetical protein